MRKYITEAMNGGDLAEIFSQLSNEIRELYFKGETEKEYLGELSNQEDVLKNLMAYQYMKEHGYYLDDDVEFTSWKKAINKGVSL